MIRFYFRRNKHRKGWGARVWFFQRRWLEIGWYHYEPTRLP